MSLLLLIVGVIACGVGFCMLKWPRTLWYVTQGWWSYDNPHEVRLSDAYLLWNLLNAISLVLAGALMFVMGVISF